MKYPSIPEQVAQLLAEWNVEVDVKQTLHANVTRNMADLLEWIVDHTTVAVYRAEGGRVDVHVWPLDGLDLAIKLTVEVQHDGGAP